MLAIDKCRFSQEKKSNKRLSFSVQKGNAVSLLRTFLMNESLFEPYQINLQFPASAQTFGYVLKGAKKITCKEENCLKYQHLQPIKSSDFDRRYNNAIRC